MDIDTVRELKNIYETVAGALLQRRLFRFVHNTLVPLSRAFQTSEGYNDDVDMDIEREESILLDPRVSASLARPEIFRTQELPSFNDYEGGLNQMLQLGDRLYQILSATQRPWAKTRV